MDDSLYEAQERIERISRSEGIARYRRLADKAVELGDGPQLKAVERLMVHWFTPLRKLIAQKKKAIAAGEPGLNHRAAGPYLLHFNSARLALSTMHPMISILLQEPAGVTPVKLANAISRSLSAQVNYRLFREQNNQTRRDHRASGEGGKAPLAEAWDALVHTSRKRILIKNTLKVAKRFSPDTLIPIRVQAQLGTMLMEMFCKVCTLTDFDKPFDDAIFRYKRFVKGHARWFWRLSDKARRIIEDGHNYRAALHPQYLPMVVPPIAWGKDKNGGYLTLPTHLVKKWARHEGQSEPQEIREAVNVLNSTPWRVNGWMLDIVKKLVESGGDIAGIRRLTQVPFPPPYRGDDEREQKIHNRKLADIIKRNIQVKTDAALMAITLHSAGLMRPYQRIYFPHQLDFTGRAYPIPVLFNHQGDDVCRGMLEFADGKDCSSPQAQAWLKIHLANRCGEDKIPFEQRIVWVDSQMDTFAGWVESPLDNTGWMLADDPFQALAAARALLNPEHGAHMPVQIDGTNNALQHYAAMLRCSDTARKVNVLPSDAPADVYSDVAGWTEELVGRDAAKGIDAARQLADMIDRKLVKSTAMTTVYGVTAIGARRQMYDYLKAAGFNDEHLWGASKYISRVVMEATAMTCPAAAKAMAWLRQSAKTVTATGRPVSWTNPMGMTIEQPYRNSERIRVRTPFFFMQIASRDENCPINVSRHSSAFAANFVHAIDSAHMMATALACHDKSMPFAGVHDAYWGLAADMDSLASIAPDQFVLIHEMPLLESVHDELQAEYGVKLEAPPMVNDMDIQEARKSRYMFH